MSLLTLFNQPAAATASPDTAELADMLVDFVTVSKRTALSGYGSPTYGAATTYDAYVDMTTREIRTSSGELVTSQGRIFLLGIPDVEPHDQVVLSTGATYPVLDVRQVLDERGAFGMSIELE